MKEKSENKMHRRRIPLKDGRYLIFYTFDDYEEASPDDKDQAKSEVQRED